jgi:hypothetical protein
MARSLLNGDLDLLVGTPRGARELWLHAPSWAAKAWGLGLSMGERERLVTDRATYQLG